MRSLNRSYGIFVALLLAFLLGAFGTYSWLQTNFHTPLDKGDVEERLFIVEKNDNLKVISQRLAEEGFIRKWWNVYYINLLKQDERTNRILPGEYKLAASLGPQEILERILSGQVLYRKVAIPEGKTVNEVAGLIAESGIVSLEEIQAAFKDPQLMYSNGIRMGSFEGYIFPDTYQFTRPADTAKVIIKRMVDEGRRRIHQELPNFNEKAIEAGLTPDQVRIFASIVEKETGDSSERGKVASVFHNRLRIGMPLQSDPTVIYGIENFNGRLTKEDLQDKTNPYNTYVHPDLPPTPICNPGIEALRAVIEPEDTDFLYFVSKNNGTHHFSSSYKEHREAVNLYQRGEGA